MQALQSAIRTSSGSSSARRWSLNYGNTDFAAAMLVYVGAPLGTMLFTQQLRSSQVV